MYWLIGLMTLAIAGLVVTGIYLETAPEKRAKAARWFKPAIGTNLVIFVTAQALLVFMGIEQVQDQSARFTSRTDPSIVENRRPIPRRAFPSRTRRPA